MKPHITTIILDFGGVLGQPQDQGLVESMASLCGVPKERFVELYGQGREDYDKGTLTTDAYLGTLIRACGMTPTPALMAEILHQDCLSWTRVNEGMRAWAEELRVAGYRTAILSNMPTDTATFIRASGSLRWVGDFPVALFSCDYGQIKPDPAFFRICLDRLGTAASECLFVDDNKVNVEAAMGLGLAGVQFHSNAETARAAAPYGVPVESLLRA